MGSIPLPALGIKPVEQPDLLGQYARALQLKNQIQNAPLQRQALQQQVTAGEQENQVRAQQLKDQQAMTAAMQQWDGKDFNSLVPLVVKNGASANAVMGLKAKALEMQKTYSDLAKNDAETGAKNIETQLKKNDLVSGKLSSVMQLPDEQLGQGIASAAQELVQGGLIDPQHAQMAAQLAQMPPAQARQQLDAIRKGYMSDSQMLNEAKTQADIEQTKAQTAKLQQETQFGPTGPAAQAKYRFILQKASSGQQLTPEEVNFAKGYEASEAKNTTQSDSLGVVSNSTNRPAGLATVTRGSRAPVAGQPQGGGSSSQSNANVKESLIDQIGQYKMDPNLMGRALYRHPELLGMLAAKYPGWDQTQYMAKANMVKSYTSGPESKSINAIGTALGHVDELRDAIDALGNSDGGIKALRNIGNKMGIQVGNDPVTAFQLIVHRVAPEITAAYVQGGGGEGERIAAAEDFNPSMSRKQLVTNWSETVKLLRSKIAQQEQQWNTTYQPTRPEDQFTTRFFSAPAKRALQRWSAETGNSTGMDGGGGKVIRYKIVNGQLVPE